MNVIVISECAKKARIKTRRIISQYLPQCGSQVWMGSISEEGLKELRKELQRHATRNMSVICHVITSRVTQKVAFVVGSRKNFDEHGHFVFSWTKQPLPKEIPKRKTLILLSEIGRLAGLLHDLGKNIVSFQEKIRGQSDTMKDPVRHERLSAHACCMLLEKYKNVCTSEDEILKKIVSFSADEWNDFMEEIFEEFDCALQDGEKSTDSADSLINHYLNPSPRARSRAQTAHPIFTVLAQLILSHHFLPYTEISGNHANILEKRYIHGYEALEDTRKTHKLRPYGTPSWYDQNWLTRVQETVTNILDFKSKNPLHDVSTLLLYSFLTVRPALTAADQIVSAQGRQVKYDGDPKSICFANPYDIHKAEMAQPLAKHLIDVGRLTARHLEWLDHVWQGFRLDYVNRIPPQLKAKKDLAATFAWQATAQKIAQKINAQEKNMPATGGFFGVMAAATGTGKTRCIPRFMSHLQGEGNIRFTLALGLRALTEQSGKDYVNAKEIGFQENQEAAVLIGGEFQNYIRNKNDFKYEMNFPGDTELEEQQYLSQLADHLYGDAYIDVDSPFPLALAGPKGELSWNDNNDKLAKMLQVPVLVCTVDHLMAGLISPKADASKRLIRILNADLVIDEIDSFAIDDIQGLARLAFLTGAAGRRVLLSSATLSAALCRYLFEAYVRGYAQYCRITEGASKMVHSAWLTHIPELCSFKGFSIDNGIEAMVTDYYQKHGQICREMVEHLKTNSVVRRLDFLDVSDCQVRDGQGPSPEKAYQTIADRVSLQINSLHDKFKIEHQGRFLSAGLVRFSQTKHALEVFKRLIDQNDGEQSKRVYLFYQANLTDANLEKVEGLLNRLLKRKHAPTEADPIWSEPEIENLMLSYSDKTDFQLVVVSTPIEEVGRDHDFDYAIIEPTSIWSTIQTAGRVLRHRNHRFLSETDTANIIMLSHPLRALFSSGRLPPYTGPGPVVKGKSELTSFDARDIFPPDMKKVIDARYVLTEESVVDDHGQFDTISALEQSRVINDIGSVTVESKNDPLFGNWLTHVSSFFDNKFPFRDRQGKIDVEIEFIEETPNAKYLNRCEEGIALKRALDAHKYLDRFLLYYSSTSYEKSGKFVIQVHPSQLDQLMVDEILYYSNEIGGVIR